MRQDLDGLLEPQVFREGDDVEVVADDVALDDEVCLDPERLGGGRGDDDGVVAESISQVSSGRVRRIWRSPASIPPSLPMIVNGGFDARTDVAHPSVASTASSTVA